MMVGRRFELIKNWHLPWDKAFRLAMMQGLIRPSGQELQSCRSTSSRRRNTSTNPRDALYGMARSPEPFRLYYPSGLGYLMGKK